MRYNSKLELDAAIKDFARRNLKTNYTRYRKVMLILYYFPQLKQDILRIEALIRHAENDNFNVRLLIANNEDVLPCFSNCYEKTVGSWAHIPTFLKYFNL